MLFHRSVSMLALALAGGLPSAWGQATVPVSGPSPFAGVVADAPAQQAGAVFPDSEVEPWLVVNPSDARNIVATWQQDRWSNGGARGLVAGVSNDGGQTWQAVPIPGITRTTGGVYERASDPWLTFAPNGHLYHAALTSAVAPSPQAGRFAIQVSRSTDGGATWGAPVAVSDIGEAGDDKESITADPTDARYVYVVWVRFGSGNGGAWLARTTDGGQTWEAPRVLFDPTVPYGVGAQTQGNQVVVAPDGTLYNFFVIDGPNAPSLLSVVRSTNKGATWQRTTQPPVVDGIQDANTRSPDNGLPVRAGNELFDVAVDPRNGTLYAVWADGRFGAGQYGAVAFSMSTTGGQAWTPPVAVNRTPAAVSTENRQAFTPSVHVAADGTVGVSYYDFRNNTAGPGALTDAWLVRCPPDAAPTNPANWHETRLTDVSFDIERAPVANGYFLGDYVGLTSSGADFLAAFTVTTATDPAGVVFRRVPAPGDANRDGTVDMNDVTALLRAASGLESTQGPLAGDVFPSPSLRPEGYGDGALTLEDATRLLRRILGMEPRWP